METQILIPSALVFTSVLLLVFGTRTVLRAQRARRVKRRLEELTLGSDMDVDPLIVRDLRLSAVPFLNDLLERIRPAAYVESLVRQAGVSVTVGTVFLLSLTLGTLGCLIAIYGLARMWLAPLAGLILGSLPVMVLRRRKERRRKLFETQLPDALDLVTGALRSGMAFSGALQLVGEESPEPLSQEFSIASEEHRLGVDLQQALKKMLLRMDSRELRLFVTAVVLQRETGGNLAEILEGAAAIIRDRFRILGDIRTLTAQARLSGIILAALPLVMVVVFTFMAPDYLKILYTDPIGQVVIGVALSLQIVGFLVIRRIVAIRV